MSFSAWAPKVSNYFTLSAAAKMPAAVRARFREEWLAYLAEMPTSLSKLVASVGFLIAVERLRSATGFRALSAIGLYLRLRIVMVPYLAEARAFGGSSLGFQLKMQPCGNRHVFIAGLYPASAIAFLEDYNETVRREVHDHALDLSAERAAIVRRAIAAIEPGGPMVARTRGTNIIIPAQRDPRGIRTLLALLWKRRERRIRRDAYVWPRGDSTREGE